MRIDFSAGDSGLLGKRIELHNIFWIIIDKLFSIMNCLGTCMKKVHSNEVCKLVNFTKHLGYPISRKLSHQGESKWRNSPTGN